MRPYRVDFVPTAQVSVVPSLRPDLRAALNRFAVSCRLLAISSPMFAMSVVPGSATVHERQIVIREVPEQR